jgi:hypothetical protein
MHTIATFAKLPVFMLAMAIMLVFGGLTLPKSAAAAGYTIDCNLSIDYPHPSTHYPGNVNVVSNVVCTAPVDYIVMGVSLKRDGAFVWPSGSCVKAGTTRLQCNASEPCHSGSLYGAQANSEVTFPPGGVVIKKTAVAFAPEQRIYCRELLPDDNLGVGGSIQSPNKRYSLIMQTDGNLVEYGPNGPLWSSCTNRWPGSIATMQGDGNLVVYGPGHIARYATGTHTPGSVLQVQDDGNMVIYGPGHNAVWASAQHPGC